MIPWKLTSIESREVKGIPTISHPTRNCTRRMLTLRKKKEEKVFATIVSNQGILNLIARTRRGPLQLK
jgi:hypothetical protein